MRKGMTLVEILTVISIIGIIISIGVGIFIQPMKEAEVYNKFKSPDKPEATYWDAFFAELRIESGD